MKFNIAPLPIVAVVIALGQMELSGQCVSCVLQSQTAGNANCSKTYAWSCLDNAIPGSYYYPTTGANLAIVIRASCMSPAAAGLYHYTVTTNNVIEGNSTVSIGCHYVAVDGNGMPLDTNGDGMPDYLEDANGNGVADTCEANWLINPFNGLTLNNGLQVFTPLK